MPAKSPREIKPSQRPLLIVLLGIVFLGGLYLAVHLFSSHPGGPPAVTEKNQQTERQLAPSQPALSVNGSQVQPAASEGQQQKSQQANQEAPVPDPAAQCQALSQDLTSFFQYLDEQPYIKDYQFENGILAHFKVILAKLFSNTPEVHVGDKDLLGRMKNMAHFYRVLGSKNIFLAKDYLNHEEGRIENDFDTFNQWLQLDSCRRQHPSMHLSLSLPALYEYAAYFLTSAGGKSYLFRRKEPIALLVQYYCILVVDKANKVGLNHYHIDLAPYINSTLSHIQQSASLQDRADYLKTLQRLHLKYSTNSH